MTPVQALSRRLLALEEHLRTENPALLPVVPTFRALDRVLYRMGLLARSDSLTSRIPWWPMIAVLGTFSSGKSTFINSYLGTPLQATGNQAVDDRFTVICFGSGERAEVLPGTALNADPRFPFFRISDEIEKVTSGEGRRIDSYLQLKTLRSDRIRGRILIDSPGFDADDQRRSVLRLVDHIIDLADLVLVFFDARHPEPGAMQDTLQHLVARTVRRADSNKFLYILNQIDTTAREDNAEAVVGAWQRSVAQAGLISGRFYGIYDRAAASPIADESQRARYEGKCAADLAEITGRIGNVETGRAYRIVGMLEAILKELEGDFVPALRQAIGRWRRFVLWADCGWAAILALIAGVAVNTAGLDAVAPFLGWLMEPSAASPGGLVPLRAVAAIAIVAALFVAGHYWLRAAIAKRLAAKLPTRAGEAELDLAAAFRRSTGLLRSLFARDPAGWGSRSRRRLFAIREELTAHIQRFNDRHADPNGVGRDGDVADRGAETAAARAPSEGQSIREGDAE